MILPRRFDATISRAEFLRLLPAAVNGEAFRDEGGTLIGASGWRIHLKDLPARGFGGVVLERQQVDIEFPGWEEGAAERFLARFSLFFQRGGG
ncbi:MAG TPA: hypothetical protein VF816_18270 [Rhodocyclaceae bacterium]